jgi:hypothetical protein
MLLERALNSVHVIAVAIWHRSIDLVLAWRCVAKKNIWNAGHHVTDVELAHPLLPRASNLSFRIRCPSLST